MSTNRFRLRVGLATLMVVSVMLALSQSAAHAAKPPAPPPPPPVTYAMRLMPLPSGVPAGTSLYATGMNNLGQVVAWGSRTDEDGQVFTWRYVWNWAPDPAQDQVISLDEEILDPAVHAVLSAELAATWDAEQQRMDVENLRRKKLDPDADLLPDVAWPFGVRELRFENAAINDFGQGTTPPFTEYGQIAAAFTFSTVDGGEAFHVFRFTPAHDTTPAEFLDLELPTGWGSVTVRAINNLGNIVGDVEDGIDAGSMPVLWDCSGNPDDPLDNVFNTMPELIDGRAWAVNDLDQVTGSMLLGGAYHAYLYTLGGLSPEDLGVLYSRNPGSIGRDINNLGDVAGWSYVTRPKDSYYDRYGVAHAFLDTGEGLIDLGALSSGGSTRACWINDIGNVVGSARSGSPSWIPTWFLYTSQTGMLDLLKLINGLPPGTTGDTCTLSGINDYPNLDNPGPFGQICGTIAIDGVWIPFVLTPD